MNETLTLPYVSFIYKETNREQIRNANSAYTLKEYSGYVLRRFKNGSFLLVDRPTKIKETRNFKGELTSVEHILGNIEGLFEPLGIVRYFHTSIEDRQYMVELLLTEHH